MDRRIGYGVTATAPIPRGTITWVHDQLDRRFDASVASKMPPLLRAALERYCYRELDGSYVLCWDHARFNNHSCRPACRTVGDFDIAVRDIVAGEELTIEYATLNVLGSFDCHCGADGCRGTIRSSDAQRFGDEWDREILDAARVAATVAQPLQPLFYQSANLTSMHAAAAAGRAVTLPRCRDLVIRSAD
jgi:uncharacterized protein